LYDVIRSPLAANKLNKKLKNLKLLIVENAGDSKTITESYEKI
jgi:hypothetical protein